ncbi:MAG: TRAP transporter small permease subunit [Kiritimatiellaeota bacterium]|nr:TRAP transporter small permease subunit [Kiritimatiellota bacterium]
MERKPLGPFWRGVVFLTYGMTAVSCAGLIVMMLLTGADVLLRQLGCPLKGAYDVVRICGGVTMACALPLTTAMKGHVAIEYFFQKLSRAWRVAVDSVMRLIMIAAFALAAAGCVMQGQALLRYGEVTATIELPIFWVPWVMAAAFAVTAVIVVFHLLYPGREMIKP